MDGESGERKCPVGSTKQRCLQSVLCVPDDARRVRGRSFQTQDPTETTQNGVVHNYRSCYKHHQIGVTCVDERKLRQPGMRISVRRDAVVPYKYL